MKLDHEYLIRILEVIEDSPEQYVLAVDIIRALGAEESDDGVVVIPNEAYQTHEQILGDEGLIATSEGGYKPSVFVWQGAGNRTMRSTKTDRIAYRLTATGHNYLKDIRTAGGWKVVGSKIGEASLGVAMSIVSGLALSALQKHLGF